MQFRTKARAVDLLGKGQIADLPTAISELWKNGYDAYADNLSAVLYTEGYEDVKKPLFVLSDDGKGMSADELENKWLILGTDSKTRGKSPEKGEETLWKEPRPVMGEKGIGRLSVSYLGSPMLMLTKKIGSPLQALYFDWRTLENYNLFLEAVNIPITVINSVEDFYECFESLKKEFLSNFLSEDEEETAKLQALWIDQQDTLLKIIESTQQIQLPSFFIDEIVSDLIGDSDEIHGTKFIIFEPDEQFAILKKWTNKKNNSDDQDIDTVEDIRTGLIGFYNEFKFKNDKSEINTLLGVEEKNDNNTPPINTAFIIKDKTGARDFIGSNAFFSADDFDICDHLIDGEFDQFGTFTGEIRIYNTIIENYVHRSNRPNNKKVSYGNFKIKLGIIPGINETSLDENIFRYFQAKLDSFGGLYIYRDNLRVLPYGRPHSDFLQFEERRTRSAGYYFFSYRRMFGYIELTRENNGQYGQLKDKAGREGFINNTAYRDFKLDLQSLFLNLAREYFGTNAKQDIKQNQLDSIKEAKATEEAEKIKEKEERTIFKNTIKETPKRLEEFGSEFKNLYDSLNSKIFQSNVVYQEIQVILRQIDSLKAKLDNLEPKKPKRFTMDARDKEKFEDLGDLYSRYKTEFETINDLRAAALSKIEEEQLLKEYENKFRNYISLLDSITDKSKLDLRKAFEHIDTEFENTQKLFKDQLDKIYQTNIPNPPSRENLEMSLGNLELEFSDLRFKYQNILDAKADHLLRINFDIDDDALVGYYKDRYEKTLKDLGDFKSLAQLGISVEIINHELNSMYSQLSTSISEVGKYLKDSKEANNHYKYLKNAFEHLDTKYQSLNPLYRKSKRTKKYIKGSDIKDYLNNFFEETFKEDRITFKTTPSFDNSETYTFESVLLPVLVNVINNAAYWVRSSNKPEILLDFDSNTKSIIICNNGPEIRDSNLEEIFDLFYTRRPKGRGIGLYLSKDSLKSVGMDIRATNNPTHNKLNGACFIIGPAI
jgi:signal transduction histidine kinase